MDNPDDITRNVRIDLVLNYHLPTDQRGAPPNGAGREAISGRQIEHNPFAVVFYATAEDRRGGIWNLIGAVDDQAVVACRVRSIVTPSGPRLGVVSMVKITWQVVIVRAEINHPASPCSIHDEAARIGLGMEHDLLRAGGGGKIGA